MSPPSTCRQHTVSFALLLLLFFAMIASPVNALTCWSGSSRDSLLTERVCEVGQVCELDTVRNQADLYGAECAIASICQRNQDSLASAPTTYIYSAVVCCTEDLCNAYPGQVQKNNATISLPSGSVSVTTESNLLGVLVITLAHQLYHNLF